MAVLQSSVELFAHIIGALLIFTGLWGMRDASASTTYPQLPSTLALFHSHRPEDSKRSLQE